MKALGINLLILSVFVLGLLSFSSVSSAQSETVTVNSRAFISETLELTVSEQGGSQLKFRIQSGSSANAPHTAQIAVNVTSNSGNPYQVTQQLQSPLENATGDEINSDNITFTSDSQNPGGTSIVNPTALGNSSQLAYSSDAQGNGNTVVINYSLQTPTDQPPGDYSGSITFTASSI